MADTFGDDSMFDAFGASELSLGQGDKNKKRKAKGQDVTEPSEKTVEVKKKDVVDAPEGEGEKKKPKKKDKDKPKKKKKREGEAADLKFMEYAEQKVLKKQHPSERCWSEVCYPANFDFAKEKQDEVEYQTKPKPKAAKEYPFVLDDFQKLSIDCLEKGQSVLVSAHTSAGKTVVAEYAIAMSLRDGQRVIYTSPIKALSNQKYRELFEEFQDVGLMTGDVTINPSASCLVMTTEILRSMLYRGSELLREVAWVIFDEIHYMRDKARGVVWEETIIMLPDKVHYVFLSATIPNASEFALWVAKLHDQPCHVVYTDFRPVPLQHYMFPSGGDGLYLVVDEKEQFKEENFQKALAVLSQSTADKEVADAGKEKKKKKKKQSGGDIYKIVRLIMERQYYPVIVFSFSKRDCEAHALQMAKLDFCDGDEKKLIEQIFNNAIDSLSDDDKRLPQVESILPLLRRGIGIHHGGLLPILKEVIEILFQEGLLKALFSTETFSMGLNMPAKTVVFTSVSKWDGHNFRNVSPGEYIQMSGRAGRRGLDDRGIIILMVDEQIEPIVARNMVKGAPDALNSSFHLGYNMLLNLIRAEEADPEFMMSRSFHQFQITRKAPLLKSNLKDLETKRDGIVLKDAQQIAEYYHIKSQLARCQEGMRSILVKPMNILPFLNPGRLLRIKDGKIDWGWGILVNFTKKRVGGPGKEGVKDKIVSVDGSDFSYVLDVLLQCGKETPLDKEEKTKQGGLGPKSLLSPPLPGQEGEMMVVPCLLQLVQDVSSVRLFIPKDLRPAENRQSCARSLKEVRKRFPDGLPLLDPIEDMKIKDEIFLKFVRKLEGLEDRLLSHRLHDSPQLKDEYLKYEERLRLQEEIDKLQGSIKDAIQDAALTASLKNMKRVLRRLGHVSQDNVITLKGRVACEISTCDELLATELMLGGAFSELSVEQLVSLLSCLVFSEKSDSETKLKEELAAPLRQMQEAARRIAQVIADARITLDVDEYVEQFQPQMMDVVYHWCRGAKFSEICKMTDIFEGTIIRCMRRLEELLRQLSTAAKAIGNTALEEKFTLGIDRLKRDIAFAASLYL